MTKLDTNVAGAASLVYSTYLGGGFGEFGISVALDASGNAYVTGGTISTNFPLANEFQTDQPSPDAFVTRLDTNGAEPLLEHYRCHRVTSAPSSVPRAATVRDQFGAHTVHGRLKPRRLCAPASKNGSQVTNETTHFVWYVLRPSLALNRHVAVTNQFGTEERLAVGRAIALLLPASVQAGVAPGPVPTDVDHFLCYEVTGARIVPHDVDVEDQFGFRRVTLAKPTILCNPASKNEGPVLNEHAHLLCYPLSPGDEPSRAAQTRDQFALLRLTVNLALQLCVPSEKRLLPSSG